MINFRDFVYGLGIMCRADLTERLKLIYRLHQPPALLPTDRDEFEMSKSGKTLLTNPPPPPPPGVVRTRKNFRVKNS